MTADSKPTRVATYAIDSDDDSNGARLAWIRCSMSHWRRVSQRALRELRVACRGEEAMAFATRPTAVNRTRWTIDASHGELLVHTGVRGRAAKLGHRLTIVVNAWYAKVSWSDDVPVAVDFAAEVDSLEVVRGDGGVKALSAPEKLVATSNALRSLDARRFPRITFRATAVEPTGHGYRLTGTLGIRDRSRECVVDLHVEDLDDSWVLSCEVVVRQSEFGIKPYSLMLGAIAVEDDVTLSFTARRAKDG